MRRDHVIRRAMMLMPPPTMDEVEQALEGLVDCAAPCATTWTCEGPTSLLAQDEVQRAADAWFEPLRSRVAAEFEDQSRRETMAEAEARAAVARRELAQRIAARPVRPQQKDPTVAVAREFGLDVADLRGAMVVTQRNCPRLLGEELCRVAATIELHLSRLGCVADWEDVRDASNEVAALLRLGDLSEVRRWCWLA